MPLRPTWPVDEPVPDDLAIFDDTIGRLFHGDEPAGFVSFRLDWMATQRGGLLWWRRFSAPYRVVNWMEVLRPDSDDDSFDDGILIDDGIAEVADEIARETWKTSRWALYNRPDADSTVYEVEAWPEPVSLRLIMLSGVERADAWERYGWDA